MRYKGFTIVEVIVVLVIISIVTMIAVPNISGYIDNSKKRNCETVTREMISEIAIESAAKRFEYYSDEYPITEYNVFLKKLIEEYSIDSDEVTINNEGSNSYSVITPICPNNKNVTILWTATVTESKKSAQINVTVKCEESSQTFAKSFAIAFK